MQGPEKNSYKEFDKKKKFLRLENSPPPPPITFLMVRPLVSHIENWPPLHNWQPDEYSWLNFGVAYNWLICHSILVWLSRLISTRPRSAAKKVQRSQQLSGNNSSTIVYVATVLTKIAEIDLSSVYIITLTIYRLFLRLDHVHGYALWDCYGDTIACLICFYKAA